MNSDVMGIMVQLHSADVDALSVALTSKLPRLSGPRTNYHIVAGRDHTVEIHSDSQSAKESIRDRPNAPIRPSPLAT